MTIYHNCKSGILINIANLIDALQLLWILHISIQLCHIRTEMRESNEYEIDLLLKTPEFT